MGTVFITTHRLPLAGTLREAFRKEGYAVELVPDRAHLNQPQDASLLVVTGARNHDELKGWIDAGQKDLSVPVITCLESESQGRRAGAEESFGSDPDPDEVVLLGHRMVQRRRLQQVTGIVGEAESIREVLERIVQIAPVPSTVLITGESGTGKELIARGIHALSSRRHRSFLAVNVAALSETLLESELFGHEKGSFTGAIDSRKGFFELADRGTLFLDEIGEMPVSTQTKLLRVLEQREFLRVGGEKSIHVDVRVIAATNRNLRQLVQEGGFRRDLYYRLNILGIEMPPLRERREDVERLIQHFVRELSERMDRRFSGITPEAMDLLVDYDWPGNVRELKNLVESMVVLSPGKQIGIEDLPGEIRDPGRSSRLLPVPVGRALTRLADGAGKDEEKDEGTVEASRFRPELEFVFRTLVELRMDMDQLRREFDRYRDEVDERLDAPGAHSLVIPAGEDGVEIGVRRESRDRESEQPEESGGTSSNSPVGEGADVEAEQGVVFRPGMTIDDLEEEAIRLSLREVGGNRRKAAESLGIGERTLYRKIQKYGIED
jgi:DNA-binding NtrC family response regulator